MKKLVIILAVVLSPFFGTSIFAQENVPETVLLNTLNGVNDLKLSNYKTEQLYEYNEGFVDKVYQITDSNKTEKDKISALKALRTDTEKDLKDLLGKDYKKYKKLMEKELKPLKKRMKLLKYIV